MGILGLLVEIYAMPNLKMNLKFDIEVHFISSSNVVCGRTYMIRNLFVFLFLMFFAISGPVQEPRCGSERCYSNVPTQR